MQGDTDFATGVGINNNAIVLNTAAQLAADAIVGSTIVYNSSGTDLTASTYHTNRDVGGTTRIRVEIAFYESGTGSAVNLTTDNIASGKYIITHIQGYLA